MKLRIIGSLFLLAVASDHLIADTSEWHSLFDGETLNGWEANERPESWIVEDGAIVTAGERSHLFYIGEVEGHDFKNFELSLEVMTTPGSNSGVYVHTKMGDEPWPQAGYELQVLNSRVASESGYIERKMTGSIYAVRNIWRTSAVDNEWFHYRIIVSGKTIQSYVNGELICQYTEGDRPWRAENKQGRYLSSGTFALQCHDPDSVVRYRNIRVRTLPDDAPSLDVAEEDKELDELITYFSDLNFALIDLGILPGSQQLVSAQAVDANQFGVTYGYTISEDKLNLSTIGRDAPVVIINDRDESPSVGLLKAAKESGAKIVFSSGGVSRLSPERLKRRLLALKESGIGWSDLWAPDYLPVYSSNGH